MEHRHWEGVLKRFSLVGRRALVTGASRGIGRALALGLAETGADVALVARTADALEETAAAARRMGVRALALPADVSDSTQVASAFAAVERHWGGLDILINNAGINIRRPALEAADEDWHAVLRANLDSAFWCAREAGRLMKPRGGTIVFVGSIAGLVAIPTGVAYAASKAGVAQMTRTLALEWARHKIRVNCIAPWYVRTPLTEKLLQDEAYLKLVLRATPMRRVGTPEDLVGAAIFLCSEASAYVTGQTLAIDGGMTIAGFERED
jgi:NAD(P)-dependent dehydrogenase (short-subunit alcohol dehydrogenase family)